MTEIIKRIKKGEYRLSYDTPIEKHLNNLNYIYFKKCHEYSHVNITKTLESLNDTEFNKVFQIYKDNGIGYDFRTWVNRNGRYSRRLLIDRKQYKSAINLFFDYILTPFLQKHVQKVKHNKLIEKLEDD